MKSRALLLAELHRRDLADESRKVALKHHVTLEEVCEPTHRAEVVKARHAIWAWQVHELGTVGAVCRIWGVDRSALLCADLNAKSPIAFVLLDSFRHDAIEYRLGFFAGREKPFGIGVVGEPESDRKRRERFEHAGATWRQEFATYDQSRMVWTQLQELAGIATFRSVSEGAPVPQLAQGGR